MIVTFLGDFFWMFYWIPHYWGSEMGKYQAGLHTVVIFCTFINWVMKLAVLIMLAVTKQDELNNAIGKLRNRQWVDFNCSPFFIKIFQITQLTFINSYSNCLYINFCNGRLKSVFGAPQRKRWHEPVLVFKTYNHVYGFTSWVVLPGRKEMRFLVCS